MQNFATIQGLATELLAQVNEAQPCDCKFVDGYNTALSQVVEILGRVCVNTGTIEGNIAVSEDRASIAEIIEHRIEAINDALEATEADDLASPSDVPVELMPLVAALQEAGVPVAILN